MTIVRSIAGFCVFMSALIWSQSDQQFWTALRGTEVDQSATTRLTLAPFLKLRYKDVKCTVLDARGIPEYGWGHIAGAVTRQQWEATLVPSQSRDSAVVIYCQKRDCLLAYEMAASVQRAGWTNTYVYEGGWEEWVSCGLKIDR